MAYNLYCKNRDKKTVKVWTITFDLDAAPPVRKLYKNAPHLFGVSGALENLGFKAFATQRICFSKKGREKKEYDMLAYFGSRPESVIIIHDKENQKRYMSKAYDWITHGVVKDYGDGDQIFLDIKYMEVYDYSMI